ncbi:hypothetical protein QCM77_02485 [Bradyrhizobium sp. SSUT18]|uniref:DUF1127 domain-containing protein n=1 Tax=Bradyrhizobium sp. SSUT18 TaxID=3040602 RepID=UPI00244D692D|nr:DUF1127 domain-containing protein [Bradyrhizobium sp. SSUT18]MDH2398857.1 hypothetical protein [Bradyrhizobium sp. SSUT18]
MPPQQTNTAPATERGAAALRSDIALARSIFSLIRLYWRALQERRWRQGPRVTLQDLSDRELMDIGLTRGEIDYITPERAIDRLRDRATDLWGRGVM